MGDRGCRQHARPSHRAAGCLKARRQPPGEVGGRSPRIARKQDPRLRTLEGQVFGEGNAETADGLLIERRVIGATSNTIGAEKSFHVSTLSKAVTLLAISF